MKAAKLLNPNPGPTAYGIAGLLLRVPFGLFFAVVGMRKVLGGSSNFAEKAHSEANWIFGLPFDLIPKQIHMIYLTALPSLEVICGIMLMLGLFMPLATLGTAAVMLSIIVGKSFMAKMVDPIMAGGIAFDTNIIYTLLLIGLFITGGGKYKLDTLIMPKLMSLLGKEKTGTYNSAPQPGMSR